MKSQGEVGKESFLKESRLDNRQDCEDDGQEEFFLPECRVVVPPPSHVMYERALQLEKSRENTLQWDPESRRLVDRVLEDVYTVLQPTKEQRADRRNVVQFVDTFVKQRIQGSHIRVFGSFVMDLYTGSSDLDLSLNMSYSPVDRSRGDKIAMLRKLTRALHTLHHGRNGMTRLTVRKIEPVMKAAVPVVKFVEVHTNIECDVSMENMDGVLKSELIGIFTKIDLRYRQLCFLLKAWAKAYNVNDSKKGTLNSLSIIFLAAFHLQTRSPPILPSFSALLEGLFLRETENCIAAVGERVAHYVKSGFGRDNKETLGQLFGSFFTKFLAVESLWEQGLCASVYEGKWISKVWAKNHLGCMSVEDFAERSQNCARAVREKEFDVIHQSFRDTVAHLNASAGSPSQIREMKHTLFGIKSLKRTSEEPLVQPVEKQLKAVHGWMNPISDAPPYVGPDPVNGFSAAHLHQSVYSNYNRGMNFSRQDVNAYQGYEDYSGWALHGEYLRAEGRGVISPVPGGQRPYFVDSGHDHMGPGTGPRPFPLHTHQSPAGYGSNGAQGEVRDFNYSGRGPGMVSPAFYPVYPPYPQMFYPPTSMYRSDARTDHVTQPYPNWGYSQLPQGHHLSQTSVHRSNR
ncbi:protein HESO1 isoform X2 [Physcomitrium patens]|nr:poly(A) RNA polymerase GLD2-like isoform X2 [Physcomitrium patens]|eukprot:XP_024362778.1 poly(A) RNA polymerase GLD2-like isoform X2 [Physcomitrella patens]